MLEAISDRLQKVFKTLRGEGHLTERHVDEALAEIRRALLAADVALPVVKEFAARVRERSLDDYPLVRLDEAPAVEVHFLASAAPPSGMGEPGVPPIAPAVANAVFAATGLRARRLPLRLTGP